MNNLSRTVIVMHAYIFLLCRRLINMMIIIITVVVVERLKMSVNNFTSQVLQHGDNL